MWVINMDGNNTYYHEFPHGCWTNSTEESVFQLLPVRWRGIECLVWKIEMVFAVFTPDYIIAEFFVYGYGVLRVTVRAKRLAFS